MTRRGATGALVGAMASSLLVGCDAFATPDCDPGIVKAFRALPPVDGVEVELHSSPGTGCTDTVTVSDPDAFVEHYKQAMREAGWNVTTDGNDVFGKGPSIRSKCLYHSVMRKTVPSTRATRTRTRAKR